MVEENLSTEEISKKINKLLNLKYLFAPICAFHKYAVGYEVYHHPPFLLIGLV
jgi:hypothetical protein